MPNPRYELVWLPDNIAKLFADNNIGDRNDLANALEGVSRTTVYRVFDADWSGPATHGVLASIAGTFDTDICQLAAVVKVADTLHEEVDVDRCG